MIHDQSNNNMCQRETTLLSRNTTTPFKAAGNYFCVSPNVFGGVKMIEFRSNQKKIHRPILSSSCFRPALFKASSPAFSTAAAVSAAAAATTGATVASATGGAVARTTGAAVASGGAGGRAGAECVSWHWRDVMLFVDLMMYLENRTKVPWFLGNGIEIAGFRKLIATCFLGQ